VKLGDTFSIANPWSFSLLISVEKKRHLKENFFFIVVLGGGIL
jgi:hypothetical protein